MQQKKLMKFYYFFILVYKFSYLLTDVWYSSLINSHLHPNNRYTRALFDAQCSKLPCCFATMPSLDHATIHC